MRAGRNSKLRRCQIRRLLEEMKAAREQIRDTLTPDQRVRFEELMRARPPKGQGVPPPAESMTNPPAGPATNPPAETPSK